jgi:sensor histidine kinase YesM
MGAWGKDRELRTAVALTVAFFLFTLVVFTVSAFFRGNFREALVIGLPMMTVDGLIGFQLFFALRWTSALNAVPRWSLITIAVVAVALVQALWDTQLRMWNDMLVADYRQSFIRAATLNTYNSGMLAALLAFQAAYSQLKEQQRLLDIARQREREAQMLALRFQLNPHFLFNTLNAISSLVVMGRSHDAETMIDRLSTFLRASLSADPGRLVSVEDEFGMLEHYLEIEAVRFGDRLATVIYLPSELANAQVPPFLLQPLVENAVKYAVAPSRTEVRIEIAARERDGQLELEVSDTGGGGVPTGSGTGVGLANVRERLRLCFGAESEMHVSRGNQGFRVTLTLPLMLHRQPAVERAALAA